MTSNTPQNPAQPFTTNELLDLRVGLRYLIECGCMNDTERAEYAPLLDKLTAMCKPV